jgi:hypothetical protein
MKHLTTEEGIDLVNQVLSPGQRLALVRHLECGCERCMKTISRWRRIRRMAAAEASLQPPHEAVRIAKAAFAGSPWARVRKVSGVIEVLFDSFLQPALAGVRSAGAGTRRMLYRADPFQVDLQIEAQGGGSVVVTGQLLDLRDPEVVGSHVRLMLSNLRGQVIRATTNQYGEFREEIEGTGDLELVFHGANDKRVTISLHDVLGPMSSESHENQAG